MGRSAQVAHCTALPVGCRQQLLGWLGAGGRYFALLVLVLEVLDVACWADLPMSGAAAKPCSVSHSWLYRCLPVAQELS
eukprot:6813208-Alexandrium_andersonii.AAC.1